MKEGSLSLMGDERQCANEIPAMFTRRPRMDSSQNYLGGVSLKSSTLLPVLCSTWPVSASALAASCSISYSNCSVSISVWRHDISSSPRRLSVEALKSHSRLLGVEQEEERGIPLFPDSTVCECEAGSSSVPDVAAASVPVSFSTLSWRAAARAGGK